MKKILVTGGAGFLGSHLCEALLSLGNKVICVDNLFTGSMENLESIKSNQNFTFMEHDVTESFSLDVDEIYNLACPASPVHYQHDPLKTMRTSVLGAMNVLEIARTNQAKILQASTSEIYGDPIQHPQKEDYWGNVNPVGIRSCYDEGKRCAETLFFDYKRQHDVDSRIVRIFNTYGPRMHPEDGRVVSNFIMQALRGNDITIYGSGLQTRSFCFYSNLIDAFIRVMNLDSLETPINLGNPTEFSIMQLAEIIISKTASKSQIIKLPLPGDDPQQRQPDISLANNLINWDPEIKIEEGLEQTIEYFRGKL
jgi:UDP-glucuronate decarboxylase